LSSGLGVLKRDVEFGLGGGFVAVEGAVGCDEQFIEGGTVEGIHRDAGTDGEWRIFALVAKAIGNALRDEQRGLGIGFRKDEDELISAITGGKVNFAGMQTENSRKATESAAADEMTASVVYCFKVVEVKENDRKWRARAAEALDLRIESFDQAAIVCQAGERIAFGQLADMFLGAFVCGGFGGQNHGSDGDDGHKRLQKQQRSILRDPDKGPVAVNGSPRGYDRENANGSGGFSAAETERGPNQKWETEIFERIIFYDMVEAVAENEPAGGDKSEKQKREFDNLLAGPITAGIFSPEQE
jgi:hypothetical protein